MNIARGTTDPVIENFNLLNLNNYFQISVSLPSVIAKENTSETVCELPHRKSQPNLRVAKMVLQQTESVLEILIWS